MAVDVKPSMGHTLDTIFEYDEEVEREKKEHLEALARSVSPNRGHTPDMKASIDKAKEMAEKMSTKDFILNTHRILSDQPEFKELVFDQKKTQANMPGPKLKVDLERFR